MRNAKKNWETINLAQRPKKIVGIGGGTASGKTTLARLAAEQLSDSCLLISHDRYYWDVENPKGHNYDTPSALDNMRLAENLRDLAEGKSTLLPVYDFASHSREDEFEHVDPRPIVLVEGILVLAIPEVRSLFNQRVFVDTPESIRLERRIARDQKKRGRSRESVLDQYVKTVKPMHDKHVEPSKHGVDLMLQGIGPIEHPLLQLVELLKKDLQAL